jgi:hypothetical protein
MRALFSWDLQPYLLFGTLFMLEKVRHVNLSCINIESTDISPVYKGPPASDGISAH